MDPYGQNQGGLGSYGFSAPAAQYPQMAGVAGHHAGFNYSPAYDVGYGPGNRVGGWGVGATVGAMGLGMSAMGFLPGAAGNLFNPIGGAISGWGAGGRAGMGLMGRVGMAGLYAAPALAVGAAASHVFKQMSMGAQEQGNIDRIAGQFNFTNPASRSGKGFNRSDSMQMGNMVREMAHMPEMLTSVSELSRIMEKVTGMGLMQGVRDVTSFNQKFKQTVESLRTVAKMIGSTMEDALKVVGESRASGFYSNADILKNAAMRSATASMTGMSQSQIGQLQAFGSQTAKAYGGTRKYGAENARRTADMVGQANQMGILSNEAIIEITGQSGPEGIQALSGSLTEATYKMASKGNLGTALALGLAKMENGRMVGIDSSLTGKVASGEMGIDSVLARGHKLMGSNKARLSYWGNRHKYKADMASQIGVLGQMGMMKSLAGKMGLGNNPDAMSILAEKFNLSHEQSEAAALLFKNKDKIETQILMERDTHIQQSGINAVTRDGSWDAFRKKLGTKIGNAINAPLKEFGVSVKSYFERETDTVLDQLSGLYKTEITKLGSDFHLKSRMGSTEHQQLEAGILGYARGIKTDRPGFLGGIVHLIGSASGQDKSPGYRRRVALQAHGIHEVDEGKAAERLSASLLSGEYGREQGEKLAKWEEATRNAAAKGGGDFSPGMKAGSKYNTYTNATESLRSFMHKTASDTMTESELAAKLKTLPGVADAASNARMTPVNMYWGYRNNEKINFGPKIKGDLDVSKMDLEQLSRGERVATQRNLESTLAAELPDFGAIRKMYSNGDLHKAVFGAKGDGVGGLFDPNDSRARDAVATVRSKGTLTADQQARLKVIGLDEGLINSNKLLLNGAAGTTKDQNQRILKAAALSFMNSQDATDQEERDKGKRLYDRVSSEDVAGFIKRKTSGDDETDFEGGASLQQVHSTFGQMAEHLRRNGVLGKDADGKPISDNFDYSKAVAGTFGEMLKWDTKHGKKVASEYAAQMGSEVAGVYRSGVARQAQFASAKGEGRSLTALVPEGLRDDERVKKLFGDGKLLPKENEHALNLRIMEAQHRRIKPGTSVGGVASSLEKLAKHVENIATIMGGKVE